MDFIFKPNLGLYLPLYELDGASFVSKDAYGHLLSVYGPEWKPDGRWFDGVDDYIKCSIANWRADDTRGTLAVWFKATTTGTLFASCDEATGNYQWAFYVGQSPPALSAAVVTGAGNTRYCYGHTPVGDGNWHFGVWSSDGSIYRLFVDLEPQTLTFPTGGNDGVWLAGVANRDNFAVGARLRSSPLYCPLGMIGAVYYYGEVMSLPDMQSLYLATKRRYR